MLRDSAETALTAVGKLTDLMRSATSESLPSYTKDTRVEPMVVLEQSLRSQAYITDVLQTGSSIFSAYYMQAVSITTNVGSIDVVRLLDKLGTDRSPVRSAAGSFGRLISMESYKNGLPTVSTESRSRRRRDSDEEGGRSNDVSSDAHAKLTEAANLAVGKMLKVTIKEGNHEAVLDIAVRLKVKTTGSDTIFNLLAGDAKDTSAATRKLEFEVGELEFWKDIIWASDAIAAKKKGMVADRDGIAQALRKRRAKNRVAGLFSGSPSVNNASAIVILTKQTARRVEKEINGSLEDYRTRQRVFEGTLAMLLFVIDTEWEHITIYTRDIEEETTLAVKELKSINRGTGPDVGEILKAYQMGNAPQF